MGFPYEHATKLPTTTTRISTTTVPEHEPDWIIRELALAIEDPAGSDELRLARALLVYARAAKPDRRVAMAEHLEHLATLWY
jgi:hypothetical protein